MAYDQLPDRSSSDANASADANQLQDNIEALKGGTGSATPTTTIEDLANDKADLIPQVGTVYIQYSDASDGSFDSNDEPATFFGGGVWARKYSGGDGHYMKEEGASDTGNQTRTNGLQPDNGQGHWHNNLVYNGAASVGNVGVQGVNQNSAFGISGPVSTRTAVSDTVNGTPRMGLVTEPINRLKKTWERTS